MSDSPDIKRYLDRTESQHIIRPKYVAAVTALLEKLDAAHGIAKDIPALFDGTVIGTIRFQAAIVGYIWCNTLRAQRDGIVWPLTRSYFSRRTIRIE